MIPRFQKFGLVLIISYSAVQMISNLSHAEPSFNPFKSYTQQTVCDLRCIIEFLGENTNERQSTTIGVINGLLFNLLILKRKRNTTIIFDSSFERF